MEMAEGEAEKLLLEGLKESKSVLSQGRLAKIVGSEVGGDVEAWTTGGTGVGRDSGKKWAVNGSVRWGGPGHLKEGGADGPRPKTEMESRKGRGGDVEVENLNESRDELYIPNDNQIVSLRSRGLHRNGEKKRHSPPYL